MHSIGIALIFNGADLVTGLISAFKEKNIQSSKLRDGIFKKVGFIICYFLALLLDEYGKEVGFTIPVQLLPCVLSFVCFTEVISILENIAKITDVLPEKLMDLFYITKKEDDKNEL